MNRHGARSGTGTTILARRAWDYIRHDERCRERDRRSRSLVSAGVIVAEQEQRRRDRLAQVVAVFSQLPWEPELPALGEYVTAEGIARRLGCSTATAWRLIAKAGIERRVECRGWYWWTVPIVVTKVLLEVCREHCARPRAISRTVLGERARIAA